MQNLAIDIGNTRIKVGLFSDHQLLNVLVDPDLKDLPGLVDENAVDEIMVCSVRSDLDDFETKAGLNRVTRLDSNTPLPINNRYKTPLTLGMDRLAAAAGAFYLYPNHNCLVIDAGTTITYDFISHKGDYLGGGISPGVELRFKALNQHTRRLPHVQVSNEDFPLIGRDTRGSLVSGVLNGVLAEIEGIVRTYGQKFTNLKVVLCGGDAAFFESRIKAPIFVVPHLVLIGLNSIMLYHAQNK